MDEREMLEIVGYLRRVPYTPGFMMDEPEPAHNELVFRKQYVADEPLVKLSDALALIAARRTTPDREAIIEECAKVGEYDQAGPKTLDQIWDAAMDNTPSSVCTYHSAPSNVVSILDKVPSVFYGVSIEQGPDGVRSVRVHDVDDTPRDREAVAFALREAADIIWPSTAPTSDKGGA